tara:strand:+ start:2262 stop:3005 length:744 start_codon:yes stop_codon:yes gene_type:complete
MNDLTNNIRLKSSANPNLIQSTSSANRTIETPRQKWKVKVMKDGKTPFVLFDKWYTPNEEKNIWKELDWYSSQDNIERAENTYVATYDDGTPKSKASRFHIQEFFTQKGLQRSHVFNYMYKQRTPEFHDIVGQIKPFCNSFFSTNSDSTLIHYYEDSEYYDAHYDNYAWTMLIWFVKEPRLFNGGDFEFTDSKLKVKLKHNRAIFFPSMFEHRVTRIKMKTEPKEVGYGRYSITHFYISVPSGNIRD